MLQRQNLAQALPPPTYSVSGPLAVGAVTNTASCQAPAGKSKAGDDGEFVMMNTVCPTPRWLTHVPPESPKISINRAVPRCAMSCRVACLPLCCLALVILVVLATPGVCSPLSHYKASSFFSHSPGDIVAVCARTSGKTVGDGTTLERASVRFVEDSGRTVERMAPC
jgi:hypothetical protein